MILTIFAATLAVTTRGSGVLALPPLVVTLVVSILAPWLVGLVTNIDAPPEIKRAISGLVAVVIGVIAAATSVDGSAAVPLSALATAVGSYVVQQASYLAVWARLKINQRLFPTRGLGAGRG